MRHVAMVLLAAAWPVSGFAEDAVIRIEAKRGVDAATSSAEGWSARFDDVVTLPLKNGWVGVALGPLPEAEAETRMVALKQAGRIPADSFVSVPERGQDLTPVRGAAAATVGAPSAAEAMAGEAVDAPMTEAVAEPAVPAPEIALPEMQMAATPTTETTAPAVVPGAAPGSYIRLESLQDRAEAEAALARWRERFPEAGLWDLPNGWSAVALGPLAPEAAGAWLKVFRKAEMVAKDAFVSPAEDLGPVAVAGAVPNLPAPPAAPLPLPPIEEAQRALRWAGLYDGRIDGKSGPGTEGAIAAEILAARQSTDPGTALRQLIERRAAWRHEVGLETLKDEATGLSLIAPIDKLEFDRTERDLSIYGPKDGSGVALILFSRPGGQQELLDMAGLATALGWVPQPTRTITRGHVLLEGADAAHLGRAEGWVREGQIEGFVLIWPAADAENQRRIAAEMSDSLQRMPAPLPEPVAAPNDGDLANPLLEPLAPAAVTQP